MKASTLYWGRNAPLVGLLKRRGDREAPSSRWAARISTDPKFGRLYVGDIFVAHLAPTASFAFRIDVARGPLDANEVLGRVAALADDPAFVGYPYPLARAHQAARVTGYDVPYPYWQLEDHYMPSAARVVAALRRLLEF